MGRHSSVSFQAGDYFAPRFWPMWCAIGLLRLIALLPYRGGLAVGRLLGRLLYLTLGSRTRVLNINLERCFPDESPRAREQIKRGCCENIGISLFELAMCWWWPAARLKPLVDIVGREHLDRVLDRGQGAILLTGHFTSLEIGARLLTLFMPVQVMYRTQRNPLFDSFLYTRRSSYFVNTVSRKNTRQLIRGIRQGVPTWYAPDQDFRRERNVFASFMGIPAATITATSRLVQSSGAAVLPFYPERKADGSGYVLHIAAPLDDFPAGDDEADAAAVNRSIETWVRREPENYLWILPRFRTRPAGEADFYG
ncbi:MAG: LpxL/LpxP family Kdo(2)-lipid IV(A) lauroyl/palmitoleoyl acyltransferase [Gammaproteobacteria bacterium]|nr:LpxL/LpxP family Kdo(2)-lipid IV(A) lauroyl/palmitoleoyl acyltransferase [Gammaproteobacteria bacterium]